MKFNIDGKQLTEALRLVGSHTGALHASLTLNGEESVMVSASGGGTVIAVEIAISDVTPSKETDFTFNTSILDGLIKNRKNISLEYSASNSMVTLRSTDKRSKYHATFVTIPYEEVELDIPKKALKIDGETHKAILEAIGKVSINNLYTADSLYYMVEVSKKGLIAACYDKYHVAYNHITGIQGDFSFTVPVKSWNQIKNLVGEEEYKLTIDESRLVVKSKSLYMATPMVQNDDLASLDQVKGMIRELPNPQGSVEVPVDALYHILENMMGILEQEVAAVMRCPKEGQVSIQLKTNYGEVSETIKTNHKGWGPDLRAAFDPKLLADILDNYPDPDVVINLVVGSYIFIDTHEDNNRLSYFQTLLED